MNSKKVIIIFIFTLMIYLLNAQGWQTQNTGFWQNFTGVQSANENESWMVGENGLVIYTDDGGENWTQQNSGVSATLWDVSFCDENNGTATGWSGAIIHTTDGGSSWDVIQDGWMIDFYAAKMISQDVAFVAGQNTIFAPLVTYTTNGWQSMNSTTYYLEQTPGNYHEGRANDVEYIDSNTWYTANASWLGDGAIARTINGGSSWQTLYWTSCFLTSIHFPTPSIGYAVGQNGIFLSSSDSGNSWSESFIPGAATLQDVHFYDELVGWVAGEAGFIARTVDGGDTWQTQDSGVYSSLASIHFTDDMFGRACGEGGTSLFTTSGGIQNGSLEGIVTLDAGNGNVQEVLITIGSITTNPDGTGFYHLDLMPGIYDLTAELDPYDPVLIEDIEIMANQTTTVDLILFYNICTPPQDPVLNEELWQISWQAPDTSLEVLYYNCFLDDFNETTEELFWQLPIGLLINGQLYTAGISVVYDEGESEVITIDFIYTGVSFEYSVIQIDSPSLSIYPNPFNPTTTISFSIEQNQQNDQIEITIYDLKGQEVKSLPVSESQSHTVSVIWDGRDNNENLVASGIYYCRLKYGSQKISKKMLLLK